VRSDKKRAMPSAGYAYAKNLFQYKYDIYYSKLRINTNVNLLKILGYEDDLFFWDKKR
jgi:hypothetical protein